MRRSHARYTFLIRSHKYMDVVKTEDNLGQKKHKLQETLKKLEEEERHKTIWEEKQ